MLQKINYVKNIGRFYDVSIGGTAVSSPGFERFNLIYADNGTGKSTISTILKSLRDNDSNRLIEKRTIGACDDSEVNLQVSDKTYIFQNRKWNQTPDIAIEVFDEEFVAKNVFSSNSVDVENRRELFNYIVLGEKNVAKVQEIEQLNEHINDVLKNGINTAERQLKNKANIDDISTLDGTKELGEDALASLRNSVEKNDKIIEYAEPITEGGNLDKIIDLEEIPYTDTISADLSSLSSAARYKAHIQKYNEWIKDGMEILQREDSDSCPFCLQKIEGNDAIKAYETVFSEEYVSLREKVRDQLDSVDRIYGAAAISNITTLIEHNNERCAFWNKLDGQIPESISLSVALGEVSSSFKNALKSVLGRKKDNLLESISSNKNEEEGLAKGAELRQAITNYNDAVESSNKKIQLVKDASKNVEELKHENEEDRIKVFCNDVRFSNEETAKVYKNLEDLRQQKKNDEEGIRVLRGEIDQSSLAILQKYEKDINKELDNFGVEFSIEGVKRKSDSSRTEGVHFNICLKGKSFDPNGSGDSPYKLSNTLSSGDKSTLAFAFFIAKYRNQDISNHILVFDDPITSLDFFRRIQTKNIIRRFAKDAAQVIVMTHSMEFSHLFKGMKNSRFIQIKKNNEPTGLSWTPYNEFAEMSIVKHNYNFNLIHKYIANPESVERLEVMRSIRPYVETTITRSRTHFAGLSLGKMIGKLRGEDNICEDYIEDLENINDAITSESSHGSARLDADDYEHIGDNELMTVCKKAIHIPMSPPKTE